MKKTVFCSLLFVSFFGLASPKSFFLRKKAKPRLHVHLCNEHVTKAINDYLKNKSNNVSTEDSACLKEYIKRGGAKIVNKYQFESTFKVKHDISIVNVETNEIKRQK